MGRPVQNEKAPIIEVELTDDAGRVSEVCSDEAHFQLMAQPRLSGAAEQGGRVQAFLLLKTLMACRATAT